MNAKKLVKKNILSITAYQPGLPIEEVKRKLGLKNVIKLASNENPLGPSPKVVAAIKRDLININRYPDGSGFYIKRSLAKNFNLKPENIILGNGSDEIIDIIVKTFLKNGEEVLTSKGTFLEYAIATKANAGKIRTVALKNYTYDVDAIKKAVTAKTKIIFIANPNNPTGTYLNKSELNNLIRCLPKKVIVVLDEAYDEFVTAGDFPKGLSYLRSSKNVIVLRTFSKAYGLAGLRIGFGIAKPQFINFMERIRQPFNTNSLAQAAAIAALTDKTFLRKTKKLINIEKRYIYEQFEKMGIEFIPTQANFILFKIVNAKYVVDALLKKGVIVRLMKQFGLNNCLRVTIGTKKENRRFINTLKVILRRGKQQ